MNLNIKLLLITPFFVPSFSDAVMRDVPNWADQVDTLLTGFAGIEQALSNDVTLYQGLAKNLDLVVGQFDERDAERQKLIKAVQDKISELTDLLAQAKADNINISQQKDAAVADLQSKLDALKTQAESDVANFNQQITQLNADLDAARQAYATLVSLDSQKATDIITQLTSARNTYQNMLDSRTNFLASLERFTNRALLHLSTEKQDVEALGVAVAGQDFLNAPVAPAATAPEATPAA